MTALAAVGGVLRTLVALAALAVLLAGLPWALAHYVGWPLPRHVPDWAEVQTRLAGPMSETFLLDLLACFLWPLWAAFTVAVVRVVPDTVREVRWPTGVPRHAGAFHGLAGVLVGTVLLTLLGNRAATGTVLTTAARHVVATGPANPQIVPASASGYPDIDADADADGQPGAGPVAPPGSVVVEAPHDGIHDSLWRIADRTLGDGARWPEIYALNQGVQQLDGRRLADPHLIHPGWVLRLPEVPGEAPGAAVVPPADPPTSAAPCAGDPTTAPSTPWTPTTPWTPAPTTPNGSPSTAPALPAPPGQQPPPGTPEPGTPTTPAPPATRRPEPEPPPAVDLPSGALVGLGTAALLCIAVFSLRLWRRRRYTPGSGTRDDLAEAPVVRAMRVAYDTATSPTDDDGDPVVARPAGGDLNAAHRRHARATAAGTAPPEGRHVVGIKDGRPLALDLARTRGLGLIGPGGAAAVRALVVALLAERHRPDSTRVDVLVPAADARAILGEQAASRPPQRLHVAADLDTLLDRVETEILTRARHAATDSSAPRDLPILVVVATPTPETERRLQAVLDNGSSLGILGVLYGQWRPGATARVRADGTVGAASPTVADPLVGSRLFTLPPDDADALVDLLRAADAPAAEHERDGRANPKPGAAEPPPPPAAPPPAARPPAVRAPNGHGPSRATDNGPAPAPAHDPTGPPAPAAQPDQEQPAPAAGNPQPAPPAPPPAAADPAAPRRPHRGPATPVALTVLGTLRLTYHDGEHEHDLAGSLAPKAKDVLAFLALHPDGARRQAIVAALWPAGDDRRLANRLYAALSQMRTALRKATGGAVRDITVNHDGRYALDREVAAVDLWEVRDALDRHRQAAGEADRVAALLRVAELYTGHFADDLTADWAAAAREALRRDVLDAFGSLVRTAGDDNPREKLDLLERLRGLDPYNEAVYRDIARTQARLGRHDAVPRTFALLAAALAEIDERPGPDTTAFFDALRTPRPASPVERRGTRPG